MAETKKQIPVSVPDTANTKAIEHKLSPEIAKEFELAGGMHPTIVILEKKYGGETVDFRTMTLAQAKELAKLEGFPYLKKKT